MNIKYYPESSNVYDSMGDFYEATGDKSMAIKHYEKALAIKQNPYTQEKLDQLKGN